ncbi:MAG: hypothetical protein CMG00_04135 [Candidatus Marinimicrobia bacterium]|nr:hypothetical protein [Candidatus Neomarinimicrobiota bacterium]|tara:strand:+ start:654 stop:2054 length:1401 start_codon:yes stop_codon:yes gene_type:complete
MLVNKVFNNVIFQSITFGIRAISDFIVIVLIGKMAGISNLGIYSFAISFSLVSRLMLDLGFGMYLVREISKNKESVNKYIVNTLCILLIAGPLLLIITSVTAYLTISDPLKINAVILCVLGVFFISISATFQTSFIAFQKMQYQTFVVFFQESLFLSGVFLALYLNFQFLYIFYIYLISRLVSMIIAGTIYNYKIKKFILFFEKKAIFVLLREVSPFIINLVFTAICARCSIIFISYALGDESVGLFEVGVALTLKGVIISQIVSKSFFPKLAELYRKSNIIDFEKLCQKVLRILIIISMPVSIFLFFYSTEIVTLFFGYENFNKSIILVKIMSVALFFKLLGIGIADILTVSDNQKFRTISVGFGAIINLLFLYFLIPLLGIKGGAVSMLATEFTIFSCFLFFSAYKIKIFFLKNLLFGFFSIAPSLMILCFLDIKPLFSIILFILSYGIMLIIAKSNNIKIINN